MRWIVAFLGAVLFFFLWLVASLGWVAWLVLGLVIAEVFVFFVWPEKVAPMLRRHGLISAPSRSSGASNLPPSLSFAAPHPTAGPGSSDRSPFTPAMAARRHELSQQATGREKAELDRLNRAKTDSMDTGELLRVRADRQSRDLPTAQIDAALALRGVVGRSPEDEILH
jgi:hypothetical protein